MVEAEVLEKKKGKKGKEGKKRWSWTSIATILVGFLAIGATLKYTHNQNLCNCPEDGRKYTGTVEGCCCDYETVDNVNRAVLHPLLQELVKTPFFRYFKVKLWCDCPFWPDDGMCKLRDCSVCECPEHEFPEPFRKLRQTSLRYDDLKCQEGKPEAAVDRTLDTRAFRGWSVVDNPWTIFLIFSVVKLWCDCPFWPDDGMCKLRDCSVCECPEHEFPEPFRKLRQTSLRYDDLKCQEGKPEAAVDRTLDTRAFRGWSVVDNPWTYDDETDNSEMTYVNLLLNPERYTGYTGTSARRIWDAIYSENCPKYAQGEICPEKKVLYKLISGLHASISAHIASDYLLDESENLWGRNYELMYDRVLKYPERVRNLYFTFLFVLRAVEKAGKYLEEAEYDTGNLEEDLKTQSLVRQILYNPKLQAACPLPFDEAKLWKGQGSPELKQQIQKQFRNISALMDCVGCEKCRLWGKLQVHGLGTALKILFSVNGHNSDQSLQFQRNEVIALVNLLNRLSESINFVHEVLPMVEGKIKGPLSEPLRHESSTRQRIWEAVGGLWLKRLAV